MDKNKCFEIYPLRYVFCSTILQFTIYIIGLYFVNLLGIIWVFLYLLFIFTLEFRLLKQSCVHCYYYDKRCAFGKGKLSSLFFKKGNPTKFIEKQITWKDMIPDFLVSIIPLCIGIWFLIIDFNWFYLILIIILIVLAFPVNGYLRGSVACKNCKQREIGCPAIELFNKKQ